MDAILIAGPRTCSREVESAVSLYLQASDRYEVRVYDKPNSALCFNFNLAFAHFRNNAELPKGKEYKRFVMLHSDLAPYGPEDNQGHPAPWVDTLENRRRGGGYHIMHACAAIKDDRGLTSTTVGSRGNPKGTTRRLHTCEIAKLPEVFDVADVVRMIPGPWPENPIMCLNTGCWIAERGDWCKKFPGFHTLDWIENDKDGNAIARFVSEDWLFGFWAADQGLRVGCTRMKTAHFGRMAFMNDEAWGTWESDYNYPGNPGPTEEERWEKRAERARQTLADYEQYKALATNGEVKHGCEVPCG
jgi:hypothetical protein